VTDPTHVMPALAPLPPRPPLRAIELAQRVIARGFTLAARSSLGSVGARTILRPPTRLVGPAGVHLGSDVQIGPESWLQVLSAAGRLSIGDRTQVTGSIFVSVVASVEVGRSVLVARNVYIADHSHAANNPAVPIRDQGITGVAPVTINDGAWLGQGVIVLPGVTIGKCAVVGANSVVGTDVPAYAVAVGAPARVIKR